MDRTARTARPFNLPCVFHPAKPAGLLRRPARPLGAALALALACACAALLRAGPANANLLTYSAVLSGANEAPANASPGGGNVLLVIDDQADTMHLEVSFAGLLGQTGAAHIHCCTAAPLAGNAGVATPVPSFPGFPAGVTVGSYAANFNLDSPSAYNPAFVAARGGVGNARDALLAGLADRSAYFNIHTSLFPAGEIRGFLVLQQEIPEPGALALLGIGLAALGWCRRRAGATAPSN
ncbi:CHRD domain-containing protein [Rugamonas sp. DEMB1]|uniref:CHRD domain-containing protein n=1 Tax=Rugamonas sp. DEMB1 TaxID=3039386 RepID=UPI00244B97D2|nr:CHRD domain-containing protein [Rugamonas sp. DEMB1]WGG52468.1 CHRD domain-containing protein [Rugamonas sp. DEMB1]